MTASALLNLHQKNNWSMVVYRIKNLGVFNLKWDVCVTLLTSGVRSLCGRWEEIVRGRGGRGFKGNITGKMYI